MSERVQAVKRTPKDRIFMTFQRDPALTLSASRRAIE